MEKNVVFDLLNRFILMRSFEWCAKDPYLTSVLVVIDEGANFPLPVW